MSDRLGVRGRLLLAFFGISAFAVLAAAAAMYSFLEVGKALNQITQERVPSTIASQQLSRQAERIAAAAPALLTVDTPEGHEKASERISVELDRLNALLDVLRGRAVDAQTLSSIEDLVNRLGNNLITIDNMIGGKLGLVEHRRELLRDLRFADLSSRRFLAPGTLVMDAKLAELRDALEARRATGSLPSGELADLAAPIVSLAPLQSVKSEVSAIHDMLIKAATVESLADLGVLVIPLRRALDELDELMGHVEPDLHARLSEPLAKFREFVDGSDSIIAARDSELRHLAVMQTLVDENVDISHQLTEAMDQLVFATNKEIREANLAAQSVQQTSTVIMVTVVVMSLVCSVLIVWFYVGRNLIARLTALSNSMLAIAGGNLEASIPSSGPDEIGNMVQALTVFRDTAIEVRKSNLREIREARRRLIDAIESISEGFSLYDADDLLVLCNSRYRDALYPEIADIVVPETPFETILRSAAERGLIEGAQDRVEEWVSERIALHRNPIGVHLQKQSDGRWVQIDERKTEDGGTVAIYTDITDLKQMSIDLQEAKEAAEAANDFLQLTEVITRAANEAVSVGTVMQMALDQVCAHTGWPVGHLYTFDELTGDLVPGGIWHIDDTDKFATFRRVTEATRFAKGVGLPGRVLASGKAAWIEDVTKDPNFPRAQMATDLGVKGAFAFPVLIGREIAAVLEFFSEGTAEPYEPLLEVMAQIGTQLGRVIERKRAEERASAEFLRIEEELQSARELQSAMLPQQFSPPTPQRPVKCAAVMQPAREVGGDFYDVIELDKKRLGIVIADVAGKGAGAALFMARAFTILDATARRGGGPGEVLSHLNDLLCVNNDTFIFVTVFYGIFDGSSGTLTFANAGHNPPFLIRPDRSVEPLQLTGGVAVGVKPNLEYRERSIEIRPGDTAFCYTDGITEAKNSSNEEFSMTNLEKVLVDCAQVPVEEIAGRVIEEVNEFTGHAPPFDDMTCVVMRRIMEGYA